ncbi:unnamed protein product [Amaranthus hypochondriacus]
MASFEPIIRMDENAFIRREKMQQPKMGRKALTDMTNSKKPLAKDRSSVKNLNSLKAPEKVVPPKISRKPLGDLTNSKQPCVDEKSSKQNCTENVSAVKKEKLYSFASGEGFLHNHNQCIKANRLSLNMSMDYFLETVALKRDSSALQLNQLHKSSTLELDTSSMTIQEMEFLDISAPPSPPTPRFAGSPCGDLDFKNLELSPLKLKDSPVRG